VLDILANAAATIAEGEVLQLTAAQNLKTGEPVYLQVVRGKTAALFAAACEVGAEIAGAEAATVAALRAYGDALGIAFQMADDLLDYGGTEALGKNLGDDFRERKVTLPVIRAVAAADAEERGFWVRVIEKGDQRDGDLAQALALMARHGALASSRGTALDWGAKARAALAPRPATDSTDGRSDRAGFVVARISGAAPPAPTSPAAPPPAPPPSAPPPAPCRRARNKSRPSPTSAPAGSRPAP
jgi:octaprenyl-diphosphate synthase